MVREIPKTVRTYDDDGYRRRAACVCFRPNGDNEVLLVSSTKHLDRWIVPGGGIEPMEEPDQAAVREVYEEAGAQGELGPLVGIFKDDMKKSRTSVFVFTVKELSEDWDDLELFGRKRKWFKMEEALKELGHSATQCKYLAQSLKVT